MMSEIRVLILDDDDLRRQDLEMHLLALGPEIQIDVTTNLDDAIRYAQRMSLSGYDYDIAFLDAKVPMHPGPINRANPSALFPDERGKLLRLLNYRTVVVNYSAYAGDEDVKKCVLEELSAPNGPVPVLIETQGEWIEEVLDFLRKKVYGRRIDEQISHLLRLKSAVEGGRGNYGASAGAARAIGGARGSVDISSLAYDVKKHWKDLDSDQQNRVREVFNVRLVGDDVLVSL